jgi:hypothetical protein
MLGVPLNLFASEFVRLAKAGKYQDAVVKLRNDVDMEQSLWACDSLAADVLGNLQKACSPGLDDRLRFVIDTVRDLVMPQKVVMSYRMDYDEARVFILKKLAHPGKGQTPKTTYPTAALQNVFYPEYVCVNDIRNRVRLLAVNHTYDPPSRNSNYAAPSASPPGVDIKAIEDKQRCFFSLGGCFTWDTTVTNPPGAGTTCGMFVRACLFAAGCRHDPKWYTNKDSITAYLGVKGVLLNDPVFVKYDPAKQPKVGDIFYIHKGNFPPPPTKAPKDPKDPPPPPPPPVDDSHVGIIVSIDGNKWGTVEGGQSHDKTRQKVRTLVINGKTATFEDDTYNRPIQGWVDIEKYTWGTWKLTTY